MAIPTYTLPLSGDKIPALGFGCGTQHRIKKSADPNLNRDTIDEELMLALENALKAGFTHLDTAESYLTRLEVGEVLRRTKTPKAKVWITDKWDPGWHIGDKFVRSASPTGPYESITKGLKLMKIDYVDLFLIHGHDFFPGKTNDITLEEAWKQMERIYEDGLAKNIGVSNLAITDLKRILKICKYAPQIDQVEYHLFQQETDLAEFCKKNNILIEAYSPLMPLQKQKVADNNPLDPLVENLAAKYKVTPADILLRWVYQSGALPLTTSTKLERMKAAFGLFDFELSAEDFTTLKEAGLKRQLRIWLPLPDQ